ncbi:cyclase family protein [Thalassotalea sp. HSM 43]|uniref:cyclase family protein n=1 Tax=Thalassotalea sp. HSM 43 TaxID=2552945 RepID=UPI001080D45B|nr:cyclase family protein [Thalassotalea sp. HSM 43]QBY05502.1 cyclase family protein [Thalassotalea sp. HSM 43]
MNKLIDLSHTIEEGMITYKGLPAPLVCDFLSREASKQHYQQGTSFLISSIELCSNTGTYLDSPFHRYAEGRDLSELELQALADLPAIKIVIEDNVTAIDKRYFTGVDLKGKAVLVQTLWCRHFNSEQYFEGHPYLTADAAVYLRDNGVKLVGIDSYNIDDVSSDSRPVHSTLLGADILIVEHMCNLDALPNSDFQFFAVPVKMKNVGTFPVRAFAQVKDTSC